MMIKLTIATFVVLSLIGSACLQDPLMNQQQTPSIPNPNFSNMLPNNMNGFMNMNGNSGLLDTLRQLPVRGLNMMSSFVDNFRNMLPGLGRNGNSMNLPFGNNQMPNQTPNQMSTPNMNGMMGPVNDMLQQTGPLGQRLSNTVNDLSGRLRNAFTPPAQNGQNGGGLASTLTNSLSSLTGGLTNGQG